MPECAAKLVQKRANISTANSNQKELLRVVHAAGTMQILLISASD
jgi:hypothetical protein